MANRAYLYSSDRPDNWERPKKDYYDSRWTIPLAWFFFYGPDDVRMVDVHFQGSHWQEVKFSAEKQTALALFAARLRLLMALVEGKISSATVREFVAILENRAGRYLLMDPGPVPGGMFGDDPLHAEQFARLVELLSSEDVPLELVREAFLPYVGDLSSDQDQCQVIGSAY